MFRIAAMAIIVFFSIPMPAFAHPLGNFTSNHLTRLDVGAGAIDLHYVLDDAEIPTFSLLRSLDAHGKPSPAALNAWAQRHAGEIAPQLVLTIGGRPAALSLRGAHAQVRGGAAGLSTLYFTADFRAVRPPGAQRVEYRDTTLPGRIGWKDVVIAPQREPTHELRVYPDALIGSPRDRTAVAVSVSAGGVVSAADVAAAPLFGAASAARMNDLSDVLARNLADPVVLVGALLLAVGLGALHALEPGHGKTLLAISLVGARATVPQAVILATRADGRAHDRRPAVRRRRSHARALHRPRVALSLDRAAVGDLRRDTRRPGTGARDHPPSSRLRRPRARACA